MGSLLEHRMVIESMDEGVLVVSSNGGIQSINPAAERILGVSASEARGRALSDVGRFLDEDGEPIDDRELPSAIVARTGKPCRHRVLGFARGPHGVTWISVNAKPIGDDPHGEGPAVLMTFADITRIKEAEETIRRIAYHDEVTGLPNRRHFMDQLSHAIALARREGRRIAVLFLDMDGLKLANDSFGHDLGDELLRLFAGRLSDVVRGSDFIARFAGDEFLVLLPDVRGVDDAAAVAGKILKSLERPFSLAAGKEIRVTVSIGIAIFPDDGQDGRTLLDAADRAMYRAKAAGGSQFRISGPASSRAPEQESGA